MDLTKRLALLLLMLGMLFISPANYAENRVGSDYFRVSGFATLALTRSGDEHLGFHRDLDREGLFDGDWSVAPDSLLGVQLDGQVNDRLGGAIQLVGKDRVEDSLDNSVEWAFLLYRFSPDWTARVGRIGLDLYMLSDYRNVGFAYLWTRPPADFYTVSSFVNIDGADLAWSTSLGEGTLRAKLQLGNNKTTAKVLGTVIDVDVKSIIGATINWESEHWQFRLSASDSNLGEKGDYFPGTAPLAQALQQLTPYWPEAASLADSLVVEDTDARYYGIGAAYSNRPWQIQSEVNYIQSDLAVFPSAMSSYVSAGYQVGSVTPFLMAANAKTQASRKIVPAAPVIPFSPELTAQLAALQQGTQTLFDATTMDQNTATAGLRWDIRYDLALKIQWDHSWVAAKATSIWDMRATPTEDKEIDTFSINLNCIF